MTPNKIRKAIQTEAAILRSEGRALAAVGLEGFAEFASESELSRFAALITSASAAAKPQFAAYREIAGWPGQYETEPVKPGDMLRGGRPFVGVDPVSYHVLTQGPRPDAPYSFVPADLGCVVRPL